MNNNIDDIIKKKIIKLFPDVTIITGIGNHQLKRHYVYSFYSKEIKYVIKFFYKSGKYPREASALTMLDGEKYKTPKLHSHGVIDDIGWITYEYQIGRAHV